MKIEEDGIELEKSPEMLASAERLSDYIRELPLTAEQNDKLVQMLLDHVGDVQRCGFNQGLKVGTNGKSLSVGLHRGNGRRKRRAHAPAVGRDPVPLF